MKPIRLFINQYGEQYHARTIKELKDKHGLTGRVSKMYVDDKQGKTYHIGYCIGREWLHVFTPLRNEVTF